MKTIILTIVFILCTTLAFAHGAPTAEEFQTFNDSFTQNFANITGGIGVIPFAIIGGVVGVIASPFYGADIIPAGVMLGGLSGYMIGQQVCWPLYGIEKGIRWCFK